MDETPAELARQACEGSTYAADRLVEIDHDAPGTLAPFLPALYDAGVRWPRWLYHAADEALVRRFVEVGDAAVLAWSPLPAAREAIVARPQWHDAAVNAGWEVTADRGVREITAPSAFDFEVRRVTTEFQEFCPWCRAPLWTVADVPAGNPVTGFAGWSGRLRVLTCWQCIWYQTLYCQVEPGGGVAWWPGNVHPENLISGGEPSRVPALGITAFPGLPRGRFSANGWYPDGSRLGGHPDWVEDPGYQRCPQCGDLMNYLGLISGMDVDEFCRTTYYLHLHAPCGLAAVSSQYQGM